MIQPRANNEYWSQKVLLVIMVAAGFVTRLYKLGAQSLWYDETVSAFLASQSVTGLIAHTARDIHPPGYYLLLHFWTIATGNSEFALAYFSLIFGVLLIPLTYQLARRLANKSVALWTALLVAFSPYNIWYSQEVRMYTLAAVLGVVTTLSLLGALPFDHTGPTTLPKTTSRLFWLGYIIFASIGLYTLYYFAFLLIVINLFFLSYSLLPKLKRAAFMSLLLANGLVLVTYLPWVAIAWRQATNPPVPPWRTLIGFGAVMLESWSALSLGQSVEPVTVWPILLLTLILFMFGLHFLSRPIYSFRLRSTSSPAAGTLDRPLFLAAYTLGPLLLIYILSLIVPLYHVRYIFTYSPAFYILLGAGICWLIYYTHRWAAMTAVIVLFAGSVFSIFQLHFNPQYQADDYRAATNFIQNHWQPGDVILVNAGYVYTALLYYSDIPDLTRQRLVPYQPPADVNQPRLLQTGTVNGNPQLGWGDRNSDFYAMSALDAIEALEKISHTYGRLWMLRAYDTVTDPTGLIRNWLTEHTVPLEDQVFPGETNIRGQGFLLSGQVQPETEVIQFEDNMALAGWILPDEEWQPGQTAHIKLWWQTTGPPSIDYKMSLKLWTPSGELAAQGQDQWPVGTLYRATAWPSNQAIYHPTELTIPPDLPPGKYWLDVELYHPETIQPLRRLDGGASGVTLGPMVVTSVR